MLASDPIPHGALGFAKRLAVLDANRATYPLVLGIRRSEIHELVQKQIYRYLESFLVRRAICRGTTAGYGQLFFELARDFGRGPKTPHAFRYLLDALKGDDVSWPSDTQLEASWATYDTDSEPNVATTEMVLRVLEAAMSTPMGLTETVHGELTVERVRPESGGGFGNLTLVSHPICSGPLEQRLAEIANHSALTLNAWFQKRTTWGEADITTRSAALVAVARVVWPGPAFVYWT